MQEQYSGQATLGLLIDGESGDDVHPATVEDALQSITEQWEWRQMDFIRDVRRQTVDFQEEARPNPPCEMEVVVVALNQVPTNYADGSGDIYDGPPSLNNPLHTLVRGLYRELDNIIIHIDAVDRSRTDAPTTNH